MGMTDLTIGGYRGYDPVDTPEMTGLTMVDTMIDSKTVVGIIRLVVYIWFIIVHVNAIFFN